MAKAAKAGSNTGKARSKKPSVVAEVAKTTAPADIAEITSDEVVLADSETPEVVDLVEDDNAEDVVEEVTTASVAKVDVKPKAGGSISCKVTNNTASKVLIPSAKLILKPHQSETVLFADHKQLERFRNDVAQLVELLSFNGQRDCDGIELAVTE